MNIDPSKWKITLPVFPHDNVMDNSVMQEYLNCPTKGLYRYGMRRGFEGKSWSIQYGLAYHKYRETVEKLMFELKSPMTDEIHNAGVDKCLEGWENPPLDHKKSFLHLPRLAAAVKQARARIENEQANGSIIITRPEEAFDLPLPFTVCKKCGHARFDTPPPTCLNCGNDEMYTPRHGGRVDQFVKNVSLGNVDMIRDFKTTSMKGPTYEHKFDPNSQLVGYIWAGEQLSGRKFDGALVETIYNTKTKGPEITQFYVAFSKGQKERWLASTMMARQMIATMWARKDELGYLAFPQNTGHCTQYGGCMFRDACRVSSGWELEEWLKNNTIESTWNFMDPDGEEAAI